MRRPRKITVLASFDVAGYTRLMAQDERGTLAALSVIRKDVVDPTLAAHGGNLFKTMGDGGLIEFPNVEDSVRWAIAFQTAMAERNVGHPDRPIVVRAAIALADIFVQGDDRFGAAIAFVDRLQHATPPGGVTITHSVRWQLVKELAAQFTQIEPLTLKDIEGPVEAWLWLPDGAGAKPDVVLRAPGGSALPVFAVAGSGLPSVAVLPFDSIPGDPTTSAIADGVVEEITATLSRIRDFTVIARNSAYVFKGRPRDVRVIGRELGVRYVLEGSVRQSGDQVRVSAQLIDTESRAHVWAETFGDVVDNIFAFEDRIAESVAGALHPTIRAAEIAKAKRKSPDRLAAYDLVLRALPLLWSQRAEANAEATRCLDEAAALDPDYPRASAMAAWARAQQVVFNWTTDIAAVRAEGERLMALSADAVGDDPTALTAVASAAMLLSGDFDLAQAMVDRALLLDPNHSWAWTRRGFLNVYRGDADAATECFERAVRLSALDPFIFNCYIGLGLARFAAGEPAKAIEWTRRAMNEKIGMTWANRDLAAFLGAAGMADDAKAAVEQLRRTNPGLTVREVAEAIRYMERGLRRRYLDGLRAAGLPE